MEPKGGHHPVRLLVAAGRSMLGLLMRGCEEFVDIDLLGDADVPEGIVLWETVPGGMGYLDRFYDELILDWLRLVRMRLERAVDVDRLVAVYDHSGELELSHKDRNQAYAAHAQSPSGRALAWLDAVLEDEEQVAPFVGKGAFGALPGEGQGGDMGRVWHSDSGRKDQLVWTEHRWRLSPRLARGLGFPEAILHTAHERQTLESALCFSDDLNDLVYRPRIWATT